MTSADGTTFIIAYQYANDGDLDELTEAATHELTNKITVFVAENNIEGTIKKKYPLEEYSQIEIGQHHNVVVIGGETHGISDEAYQ